MNTSRTFFQKKRHLLIHYMTTIEELYMFTMDYDTSPFDLLIFLKSLEKSNYKFLMKEIED